MTRQVETNTVHPTIVPPNLEQFMPDNFVRVESPPVILRSTIAPPSYNESIKLVPVASCPSAVSETSNTVVNTDGPATNNSAKGFIIWFIKSVVIAVAVAAFIILFREGSQIKLRDILSRKAPPPLPPRS